MRPVINLKTEDGVRKFEAIATEVADLVLEFGGALSGEHGDGLVRSPFMRRMFGDTLYEAFREIKQTFDPLGILNPGKIVDAPPMTSNLRFGATIRHQSADFAFDFSEYGGLGGAVEMCSGVGACRKKLSGTMCPSYMATRDEAHTTRGRANVLRLAMTGSLASRGLATKASTRCSICAWSAAPAKPNARSASIWRASRANSWPITGSATARRCGRSALGNIARAFGVGQPVRAALQLDVEAATRWMNEKCWIDRRIAAAPGSARPSSNGSRSRRELARRQRQSRLFNDTFPNHYDPEIGIAAVEVLERGGCRRQRRRGPAAADVR